MKFRRGDMVIPTDTMPKYLRKKFGKKPRRVIKTLRTPPDYYAYQIWRLGWFTKYEIQKAGP